jgi:hypothetical protein
MKLAAMLLVIPALGLPCAGLASTAHVSPAELVRAIQRAGEAAEPDADVARLSPRKVRVTRCVGPSEEPTEFRCAWLERTSKRWRKHETWLAIDGQRGWADID